MSISRQEERAVRDIGRRALEKAATAGSDKQAKGVSRMFATVTRVGGDGPLDVDLGSAAHPQQMLGLRMTSACYGVQVGNRVIVDTYAHVSVVTGILANSDSAPYVTSSASFVTDGPVTAPNDGAWAWATLTQFVSTATPPAALSSDRTSLRVARAGLYLVTTKGVVYDAAPGDLVHLSLLQDGQGDPRVNVQAAVQSNWDQVSGSEVVRLEPSQVLRLGYRCEQGGGSKVNSGATLCLTYLGA